MSGETIGQILTKLLSDAKSFKEQVDLLNGNEILKNYRINREWDALTARYNAFRTSVSMLAPEERQSFIRSYSRERDELASLIDELTNSIKEKSHTRKDAENAGKWLGIATGVAAAIKVVADIIIKQQKR